MSNSSVDPAAPTPSPSPAQALAERARAHAADLGFTMSSNPETGRLLAVLAAAVPAGGRILELGTGTGVGTAALLAGLGTRTDVTVTTVELDPATAERARDNAWPDQVRFHIGDAVELLPGLGLFDLVYADSQGGKWYGLDRTLAALAPRGVLLVDDMTPEPWWSEEHRTQQEQVRATLISDPRLATSELSAAGGLILAARLG